MRNRIIALVSVLCLTLAPLSFAQDARDASPLTVNHANTNFTNVGLYGLDQEGNPGYLIMTGVSTVTSEPNRPNYYLWVDDTGDLCIASYVTLAAFASFPSGSWGNNKMNAACTKVGGQS